MTNSALTTETGAAASAAGDPPSGAIPLPRANGREAPGIEAAPITDARGFVVLFDLWLAGKWIGSRRTAEQCELELSQRCGLPIEAVAGSAW